MEISKTYNDIIRRLPMLIMALSMSTLGCSKLHSPLGMTNDGTDSDEEADLSHLPPETQHIVARTRARTHHYQQQAEEAKRDLEDQKQEHTTQLALLQVELATNMLKLSVPVEEVAAATGLSSLDVRSKLLQEIRAVGRR